jgi:hypothetical protein
MTPERTAALVARWVRFYTRDLPAPVADRRIGEIDADLHDHIAYERATGTSDRRIAVSILSRMVRGAADDVVWRSDQHVKATSDLATEAGGAMHTRDVIPPPSSPQRPASVTVLAILAALGGVGAVLGVLAGAFVIHGLASIDATDVIIVTPALALAALYLVFAYGAWTLRSWAWMLGIVAGVGSIVYTTAVLVGGWAELMRDAPPLAMFGILVVVIAAVGLFLWSRPDVKAAFERA